MIQYPPGHCKTGALVYLPLRPLSRPARCVKEDGEKKRLRFGLPACTMEGKRQRGDAAVRRLKKAYLEITNVCNLDCRFCPGTRRPQGFLSPEGFQTLGERLRPHTGYLYLHLMGEPLLHPRLEDVYKRQHIEQAMPSISNVIFTIRFSPVRCYLNCRVRAMMDS